jgi:TPR repeat protein
MIVPAAVAGLAAELPDLAQLKLAAESGDAVAQYDYAGRISLSNQSERIKWLQKSAELGYAPAQDALAENLSSRSNFDLKKKKMLEREAVQWASRAAYQGLASAQGRISGFYKGGLGVAKDPIKAYMWAQIAVQTSGSALNPLGGMMYKANRDVLIANTSSTDIAEGQRLAAIFIPAKYSGLNPVEVDVVFAELNLSAVYEIKKHQSAVVNNVRFTVGETKELKLAEQTVSVTCLAIEEKVARFGLAGTNYQTALQLKR